MTRHLLPSVSGFFYTKMRAGIAKLREILKTENLIRCSKKHYLPIVRASPPLFETLCVSKILGSL